MPKFDESILRPIRSVAKDYTIYKYDNGYMISIYVTDASENNALWKLLAIPLTT